MGVFDSIGSVVAGAADVGKGVAKGAGKALWSTGEGAVDLARAGYALATDAEARSRAYDAGRRIAGSVAGYADKAVDDPAILLRDMKGKALEAYTAAEEFRANATPEQWGELVGGGAVEAGLLLLPATKVGKLGKLGDEVADTVRAVDKIEDVAPTGTRPCPKAIPPIVETETVGRNTATWTLDERGRATSVRAKLSELAGESRSSAEKKMQGLVGKEGIAGDEGGHLIGHRFMGDQGLKNLFPQNANLNKSAYKKLENEWADWIDSGYEVNVEIDLYPPGEKRPDNISVHYKVVDPKTGDELLSDGKDFPNKAGQVYNRVPRSDM
nr:DNA/RNA non-specific endonuclease [uncultured Azospirillum sp.]